MLGNLELDEDKTSTSESSDLEDLNKILLEIGTGKRNKKLTLEEMTPEQKTWINFRKRIGLTNLFYKSVFSYEVKDQLLL